MGVGMLCSIPIMVWPFYQSVQAYNAISLANLEASLIEFNDMYRQSLITYGVTSGVYFLVLSTILLILFWRIFVLIDDGKKLSESLQH